MGDGTRTGIVNVGRLPCASESRSIATRKVTIRDCTMVHDVHLHEIMVIHARTCDVIACNDDDGGDGAALASSLQTRARLAKMTVDWDVTAFASSLQMMADWDDAAYAN